MSILAQSTLRLLAPNINARCPILRAKVRLAVIRTLRS